MSIPFPAPGIQYGKRIVISVIEQRARDEPDAPWVSVPVDNADLSKGYKDITYSELNNAANNAAKWFIDNLPVSPQPFQPIAYAGPKDPRYAIFAVAAGKLHKKLILPNSALTEESHAHILKQTKCEVYLTTESEADVIKGVLQHAPGVQFLIAPNLDDLFRETKSADIEFGRSWDEAKDDPWLVFQSSGTTGPPKPLTHTFRMVASLELPGALDNVAESHIHQYANKRWYTHLPTLHYVGMVMVLIIPPFVNMTTILSPPDTLIKAVPSVLQLARADGALFTPSHIHQILSIPDGLQTLQNLEFVHYAGAPLERNLGDQLVPYTKLAPLIGCTEAGHHFTETRPEDKEDWDYFSFQPHAGVKFEHRLDELYEMVIVRQAECAVQPIFIAFPELSRYETKDLWTRHPTRAGLWKTVARTDDFVLLSDNKRLFVPPIEKLVEQHPGIQAAVVGGNGCPALVLLLEILGDGEDEDSQTRKNALLKSLEPLIARVNQESGLGLVPELTIVASKSKPFQRTVKGTVARAPTLGAYEDEIRALF